MNLNKKCDYAITRKCAHDRQLCIELLKFLHPDKCCPNTKKHTCCTHETNADKKMCEDASRKINAAVATQKWRNFKKNTQL